MRRGDLFCSRLRARHPSSTSPPRDLYWTLFWKTLAFHVMSTKSNFFLCSLIACSHSRGDSHPRRCARLTSSAPVFLSLVHTLHSLSFHRSSLSFSVSSAMHLLSLHTLKRKVVCTRSQRCHCCRSMGFQTHLHYTPTPSVLEKTGQQWQLFKS